MKLPVWIGLRYSRSRKGSRYLSFVSGISFFGMLLGVIALTVVVSVMNGFDRELKYRILGVTPHIVIEPAATESAESLLAGIAQVNGYARFIRRQGVVVNGHGSRLVSLFGVEPGREAAVSVLPEHMVSGSLSALEPGSHRVIVGRSLAMLLGVRLGDAMTVIVPQPGEQSIRPRLLRLTLAGTFDLGSELDYQLFVLHGEDLAMLLGEPFRRIRVRLDDVFAAPRISRQLTNAGAARDAVDWTEEFGDFFKAVQREKTMMFVLLTLIVAIAAFNIVSSLSMMVKEKQADIAIYRTLGMTPGAVMGVFMTQGIVVGLLGTLLGLAVGIPLAFLIPDIVAAVEGMVGARMLAGTYFDRLPVDVRWPDLVIIALVSVGISVIATLYPAYQASRLQPASVLRYE